MNTSDIIIETLVWNRIGKKSVKIFKVQKQTWFMKITFQTFWRKDGVINK